MLHCRLFSLVCLVAVASAGCGGDSLPYDTAKISGTVSIDGTPVETGQINFISDQSKEAGGSDSAKIVGGKFSAKKVPQGKVRVFILATRETGRMIPGSSAPVPEVEPIVPEKYRQGIEMTIAGNETDKKIELVSK